MRDVQLSPKQLTDYEGLAGNDALTTLREAAEPLEGVRLLHVNSTAFGGGVAELLTSLVPLMRDLGIDAHWKVLDGHDAFFWVTKTIHNGLHGAPVELTPEMQETYLAVNEANAADLEDDWDAIVVHDPQPMALPRFAGDGARWIWRCHVDPSAADPGCRDLLARFLPHYVAGIFSLGEYAENGLAPKSPTVIHPSIDPLTPKNRPMAPEEVEAVADRYGVDPNRPSVCAVGRFDPWKDPLGVIDVYRTAKGVERNGPGQRRLFELYRRMKGSIPELQLLLIASMAHDDPEGWDYYERTLRRAGEDPDIHVLTNLRGVGGREVNAFQRLARASLLRSRREGFGLVVAESLWKRVPVIGTRTGGIPLQILHGETGYLAGNGAEAADHLVRVCQDPELRARLGEAGRSHVQRNFLVTRHLRDYVHLLLRLADEPGGGDA